MREAVGWSAFYIALPLTFAVYVWQQHGQDRGLEYLTGYLVEKSLSVDNLFVFMLLLGPFAVPKALQQRVLILAFIGAKLTLHWAHLRWEQVPEIPTLLSLAVIVAVLAVTTVTSLAASRRSEEPALR